MAHFNELYLPGEIEAGAVYGPEYATEVVPVESGHETRNSTRDGLCVGELSFAPTLEADYPELLKHFRVCRGQFNTFRFTDLSDFECAFSEGIVVALTPTTFQLYKQYAIGSRNDPRIIQAPIAGGFAVKLSGTLLTLTTDYTLDDATGILTVPAAPGAADLTWAGPFDNVVRFATDRMATTFAAAKVLTWGGIPIKEVPL